MAEDDEGQPPLPSRPSTCFAFPLRTRDSPPCVITPPKTILSPRKQNQLYSSEKDKENRSLKENHAFRPPTLEAYPGCRKADI